MRRAWKDQRGQATVEFVLVLPVLLLLTFGTIELGIFLQRQLVMGGASFIAARAAAVSGPETNGAVQETLKTLATEGQAPWLGKVVEGTGGTVKATKHDDQRWVKVAIQKQESWTGLVAGASSALGGNLDPEVRLATMAVLNQEYVPGNGARSAARSHTRNLIDYQTQMGNLQTLAGKMTGLTDKVAAVATKIPGIGNRAASLVYGVDPLRQAVDKNPGEAWNAESRFAGDWYLDRQAEEPTFRGRDGLGQSALVYQGLQDYQLLANGIYALKQAGALEPNTQFAVEILTGAAVAGDRFAMSPLANGMQAFVEGSIFQAKAQP